MAASGSSDSNPLPSPQDTGTFEPLTEQQFNLSNQLGPAHIQHISSMSCHERFSSDELRVNDYKHSRGIPTSSGQNKGFTMSKKDLVGAALSSSIANKSHDSCRAPNGLSLSFRGEVVTIAVGTQEHKEDFITHRDLVTWRSAFVREALKDEWKEGQTGTISLADDEPEIFSLYHSWLYAGCIYSIGEGSGQGQTAQEYEKLVKCYILGEKLLDSKFKDCVVDCIVSLLLSTQVFNPKLSHLIYENTPAKSLIRKLWLDTYIFCGTTNWLSDSQDYHPDFLLELSRRQMSSLQGIRPQNGAQAMTEACTYHEDEDGICYKTGSVPVMDEANRGVVSALWS